MRDFCYLAALPFSGHIAEGRSENAVRLCLAAKGQAHEHEPVSHAQHLVNTDALFDEVVGGLEPTLRGIFCQSVYDIGGFAALLLFALGFALNFALAPIFKQIQKYSVEEEEIVVEQFWRDCLLQRTQYENGLVVVGILQLQSA